MLNDLSIRRRLVWLLLVWSFCIAGPGYAAPVAVRFPEGVTHGYLTVRDEGGSHIADGELIQTTRGDLIDARLIFRFKDGSVHDERVTFTQRRVFSLQTYTLQQRGPSFPSPVSLSLDRKGGVYRVQSLGTDPATTLTSGRLDLPPDLCNGMVLTLLRNLPQGGEEMVHVVAFTPEPKVVPLRLVPGGTSFIRVGQLTKRMTQYVLEPKLGRLTTLFGRLLGKLPQKFHYRVWLLTDDVPAFAAFEGPLYLDGPTWRIEQNVPALWPVEKTFASVK